MPNPFTNPKRPYRLSAAAGGVPAKSGFKTRRRLKSPGPTTFDGKVAIRNNNHRKHHFYTQMPMPGAAAYKAFGR